MVDDICNFYLVVVYGDLQNLFLNARTVENRAITDVRCRHLCLSAHSLKEPP